MHWTLAGVVALMVLGLPATLFVALGDGGPAPEQDGGATIWRPVVEEWRVLAVGPSGESRGRVLCSDADPCAFERLAEAHAANMTCAWAGRVWLTGGSAAGTPAVRRDVNVTAAVVIEAGRGNRLAEDVVNASVHVAEFPVPWPNGWWWRVESERLHVTTPAPCDARVVKIALNVHAGTLTGGVHESAQTVRIPLAPWPDSDAA